MTQRRRPLRAARLVVRVRGQGRRQPAREILVLLEWRRQRMKFQINLREQPRETHTASGSSTPIVTASATAAEPSQRSWWLRGGPEATVSVQDA